MNESIKLINPSHAYSAQIWAYKQDFHKRKESLAGCGSLERCIDVDTWLKDVERYKSEETCPKDKVPSTIFLAIRESDDKLVGIIDFRHHINHPILSVWGGHIGFSVLHDEGRKGYAKEMLRQMFEVCKSHGLKEVLVTCDEDNIGSRKTILSNGGIFEKSVFCRRNYKTKILDITLGFFSVK